MTLKQYPNTRLTCGNRSETYIEGNPGESPNDRNDRAIRVCAAWYQSHAKDVSDSCNVIMLTNDADNLKLATESGLACYTGEPDKC